MATLIRPIDVTAMAKEMAPIIDEAGLIGFGFIDRLWLDWETSANKLEGKGELFFGLFQQDRLTGMGGLNRDPFTDEPGMGRLRHLYVLQRHRRLGFGRMLVEYLRRGAAPEFSKIRLRTDRPVASIFYENLGFFKVTDEQATHDKPIDCGSTSA